MGDAAASAGVQILLETHGDFSASPPCVEVMQLANHPHVGLVWDTHHPWRFHGEPLAETWQRLRPWTRHTHWKDSVTLPTRAATEETTEAARAASQLMAGHQHADYVLFRGGEFPAIECLRLLLADGYTGWHSLEFEQCRIKRIPSVPPYAVCDHLRLELARVVKAGRVNRDQFGHGGECQIDWRSAGRTKCVVLYIPAVSRDPPFFGFA